MEKIFDKRETVVKYKNEEYKRQQMGHIIDWFKDNKRIYDARLFDELERQFDNSERELK